jgi:ribosome-associated protein
MIKFMDRPMESTVGDQVDVADGRDGGELLDLVHAVVQAADGRKASDIVALSVSHVSTLASVLVFVSGTSRPQNQAIAAAVRRDVHDRFPCRTVGNGGGGSGNGVPEGTADSGWMLLDYGSVMVHIMSPKSRLFYNVEGQRREKGGRELDLTAVLVPNTVPASSSIPQEEQQPEAPEDDPFWS